MKHWWNWRKRDAELEKEIQHHLRMAEAERVERGVSPRDAQAGALQEFGNVGLVKETWRAIRGAGAGWKIVTKICGTGSGRSGKTRVLRPWPS